MRILLFCACSAFCLARRVQQFAHERVQSGSVTEADAMRQDDSLDTLKTLATTLAAVNPTVAFAAAAPGISSRRSLFPQDIFMQSPATVERKEEVQAHVKVKPDWAALKRKAKISKKEIKKAQRLEEKEANEEARRKRINSFNYETPARPMCVGLNHKTASVDVREKLAIPEANWNAASADMVAYDSIDEAAVLSTCNRFEIYLAAQDPDAAEREVIAYLVNRSGVSEEILRESLFLLRDDDAIFHLCRVTSGLDSLVLGEGQIAHQVKKMYQWAIPPPGSGNGAPPEGALAGSGGKVLGRLFTTAIGAGKRVRSDTDIQQGATSISSAAVDLAMRRAMPDTRKILSELRVTIIGAGKMSNFLCLHLAENGCKKVTVLNRSPGRAQELAKRHPSLEFEILLMDSLDEVMKRSDLAFTSTGSADPIITEKGLEVLGLAEPDAAPLMLIDISVPRNIEAECNNLPNVHAYNVDDLQAVVAENQAKRAGTVTQAEVILREELERFKDWHGNLRYVPVIVAIQDKYDEARVKTMRALERNQPELWSKLDRADRQQVDAMLRSIIAGTFAPNLRYLKSDYGKGKIKMDQFNDMFKLNMTTKPSEA